MPQPGTHQGQMEVAGRGTDTDHVRIRTLPGAVQREHHRGGLLYHTRHRKGGGTEGEGHRACGYHQHTG